MRLAASSPAAKATRKLLTRISREYHQFIPITEMMDELREKANLTFIQEDGEEWSGIFCGREGEALMVLADATTLEEVDNARVALQWYKLQTQYEVNAYLTI